MRVLLTGATGFTGSHLAEYLLGEVSVALDHPVAKQVAKAETNALEVHCVIHRHDRRIHHLRHRMHLHQGDLRNGVWVNDLIQTVEPDYMMHLAALSDVGGSWKQPWTTYELNIQCQLNLLEALRRWSPACRALVVTSNEVYGLLKPDDLPIDEETPFRPNNPYGVSKVTQDMMALQYWLSHQLPTIRVRSFNHIGPGQADAFAASAFARQIAEIEVGQRLPVVTVGNLESHRDFTDVRDVVRAYWSLMTMGEAGQVYNVGSGQAHSVRWLLDTLLTLTPMQVEVKLDSTRLRPSDVPLSICDNSRLVHATGWQPQIDIRQSLQDLLDDWRKEVRSHTSEA